MKKKHRDEEELDALEDRIEAVGKKFLDYIANNGSSKRLKRKSEKSLKKMRERE